NHRESDIPIEEIDKPWEDGDRIMMVDLKQQIARIRATKAQALAEEGEKEWMKRSFEEVVPEVYHEFKD
ncbi:hypothetical protein BDN72DRAFT_738104, partial [Pluteus cervinus]